MPYQGEMKRLNKAVTYEMSYDKHKYIRREATVVDRLSNIGGLFGALTPLCYAFVTYVHYKGQYMYLMKELFVNPNDLDEKRDGADDTKEEHDLRVRARSRNLTQWTCFAPLWLCFRYNCAYCCKKKILNARLRAYEKVQREVKVTHIVKQLRVLRNIVKTKLNVKGHNWTKAMALHGIKDYRDFSSSDEELQKLNTIRQLRPSNQVKPSPDFSDPNYESSSMQLVDVGDSKISAEHSNVQKKLRQGDSFIKTLDQAPINSSRRNSVLPPLENPRETIDSDTMIPTNNDQLQPSRNDMSMMT